jgi:hypothetical protein
MMVIESRAACSSLAASIWARIGLKYGTSYIWPHHKHVSKLILFHGDEIDMVDIRYGVSPFPPVLILQSMP